MRGHFALGVPSQPLLRDESVTLQGDGFWMSRRNQGKKCTGAFGAFGVTCARFCPNQPLGGGWGVLAGGKLTCQPVPKENQQTTPARGGLISNKRPCASGSCRATEGGGRFLTYEI